MRLTRRFLVLTMAILIPVLGMGVPAAAAAAPPAGGSADAPVDYTNNCAAKPAPGTFTCFSLRRTPNRTSGIRPMATGPSPYGFGPADLQSAYALPSSNPTSTTGAGQTVYVIDAFGYPSAEADLAVYRKQYGLPACTSAGGASACFKKLNQHGVSGPLPAYDAGWAGETALDLAMVSAVCPNCSITLIEADDNSSDNLLTAVDLANQMGANFVSMSWGGPETGREAIYDSQYFNRTGVVYAASAGDGGYEEGSNYPSTSNNVVAVGGTTLVKVSSTRGWSEHTWGNDIAHGTGSGCSSDETKPTWQAIIAGSVCTKRAGNDVSAVADPDTGVNTYQTAPAGQPSPGWQIVGGTSASAPIIAAVYALANPVKQPGTADPTHPASYPYANAGSLNDVAPNGAPPGINGFCSPDLLCTEATGWDGPTGLGTPHGTAAFKKPAQAIIVTNPDNQASPVSTSIVNLQIKASDTPAKALVYSAANLPAGLKISSATGVISGTPTTLGAYQVTVTAKDSTGASSSAVFPWTIGRAGTYLPIPSNRLLDTRYGVDAPQGAVAANGSVTLQVLGRGGVPASGVSAVVLNVTATGATGSGYVQVYPHGGTQPATSNLNFVKGQTVPNLVFAPVGADGKVTLFASAGTDLVADVSGFYLAGSAAALAAVPGSFAALPVAKRILDTRVGTGAPTGAVGAGKTVALNVLGVGGVPAKGVSAVVLNVTVAAPAASGHVVVWKGATAKPATSNLNYVKGQIVANLVVAPVGADGKVQLFTLAGAQLIADVAGYFTTGPAAGASASGALSVVTPSRVLDTRTTTGGNQGSLGNLGTIFLKVTGVGGVPSGATAVVVDLTAVSPTGAGYVTAYSGSSGQPLASNVNYVAGQTVPDLAVVPVDADGYISLTVDGAGTVDLIADVFGYFGPASP